jgi:molybdopterin/thiamine biosynthesis adenylyltransferase
MSLDGAGSRRGPTPALDLGGLAEALAGPQVAPEASWRPIVVRLRPGELDTFASLCAAHGVACIDPLDRQLADLAAVRLPAAGDAERRDFLDALVAEAGGTEAFGNWVYVPWEAKVVHLLEADDYFDVITDRNRDKLTREEQRLLRTRRVGVIGLSVGGEAALTVAQEHLCGEIVLADFDRLDLSNLNRLGAGFDDLGQNKAILVARRVAKVDPYLGVTLYPDGVTPEDMDAFLDGLDLLVEECDGLAIKLEIRRRARERGLNLVFAADERGFLSVEPYGLYPELPPFHGRIERPQGSRESYPTPLDFMKDLTEWMGGWEQISERSRRSLEKLGTELCGYPQLASEARYAAGQVGYVARRLLLGERVPPYFGHLDLDELLPGGSGRPAG